MRDWPGIGSVAIDGDQSGSVARNGLFWPSSLNAASYTLVLETSDDGKECARVPVNDQQPDFDRDSFDQTSADLSAAGIVRKLAAQLEHANFTARSIRTAGIDAAERAERLDFALAHLASAMSEIEVIGLVNALRYTADSAQDEHVCEFCGSPTEPWSMLTGDPFDDDEDASALIHHRWDQYGVTLCKSCHLSVRQARWQSASQM